MINRYAFVGGNSGAWQVTAAVAVCGESLPPIAALDVVPWTAFDTGRPAAWVLSGLMSHLRYATRGEVTQLRSRQEPLGRVQASCAALIPIRKSRAWWDLAQDERRAIFEEQSRHTAIGMAYLPAVARQLYHCRDLDEPFDFLTWFEYAPDQAGAFDELLAQLRASREWTYVERETDIRLERR